MLGKFINNSLGEGWSGKIQKVEGRCREDFGLELESESYMNYFFGVYVKFTFRNSNWNSPGISVAGINILHMPIRVVYLSYSTQYTQYRREGYMENTWEVTGRKPFDGDIWPSIYRYMNVIEWIYSRNESRSSCLFWRFWYTNILSIYDYLSTYFPRVVSVWNTNFLQLFSCSVFCNEFFLFLKKR